MFPFYHLAWPRSPSAVTSALSPIPSHLQLCCPGFFFPTMHFFNHSLSFYCTPILSYSLPFNSVILKYKYSKKNIGPKSPYSPVRLVSCTSPCRGHHCNSSVAVMWVCAVSFWLPWASLLEQPGNVPCPLLDEWVCTACVYVCARERVAIYFWPLHISASLNDGVLLRRLPG